MKKSKITIIGLGYTGLPLLIAFYKKKYHISGFDLDREKVLRLKNGIDDTREIANTDLGNLKKIKITSSLSDIKKTDVFVISVPTPIYKNNAPDLRNIILASKMVGKFLKKNNIVIYESTVYPGCTEEVCIPILEKISGLKINKEFYCGYSPERINPGDKTKKIQDVIKITSGSNKKSAKIIDKLYSSIIKVGTYQAPSIKVAEAAKVIENIQRDINIALVNELSMLFHKLNLNSKEVLDAANTKWNFINFRPGLVGGHCISVDPYYLTFKAKKLNFKPRVILAGRDINNQIPNFIVSRIERKFPAKKKVLVLGFSFKENCTDFRNTKVANVVRGLEKKNYVEIFDPLINVKDALKSYKFNFLNKLNFSKNYDLIILAVPHTKFNNPFLKKTKKLLNKNGFIFDVKSKLRKERNIISL